MAPLDRLQLGPTLREHDKDIALREIQDKINELITQLGLITDNPSPGEPDGLEALDPSPAGSYARPRLVVVDQYGRVLSVEGGVLELPPLPADYATIRYLLSHVGSIVTWIAAETLGLPIGYGNNYGNSYGGIA